MVLVRAYAPAWLTAGFVVGCLFGWCAFRAAPAAPARPLLSPRGAPEVAVPATMGGLATVESHFRIWGGYAVWENDMTEIVALSVQPGRIQPEYYQVLRAGRRFYFRTLPHLTRPLIDHGELARCPLAFTETMEMHEKYYLEHPDETPGRYSLEELMGRAPLLPPRSPVTADDAAKPTDGPSGQPLLKVPPPGTGRTTPRDWD